MGYVYVLGCFDGSYYLGSSADVMGRVKAHQEGKVKYTKSRLPVVVLFIEEFRNYQEAYRFEIKAKSWKKRSSIEKMLEKSDNIASRFKI